MNDLRQFVDKQVEVELSGNIILAGKMIDLGLDVMVLYHERQFFYIPLLHLQKLRPGLPLDEEEDSMMEIPMDYQTDHLSFRQILNHAKGLFVEIYVAGNKSIHGYLTSIMNDYFVFYSPVYKAMFVSLNHLKWLIPYRFDQTPYSLDSQFLHVNPVNIPLSRTFEEQCKRFEGKLVVFDLGDNPAKIGLLREVNNRSIELVLADGDTVIWNLQHVKTAYAPQ